MKKSSLAPIILVLMLSFSAFPSFVAGQENQDNFALLNSKIDNLAERIYNLSAKIDDLAMRQARLENVIGEWILAFRERIENLENAAENLEARVNYLIARIDNIVARLDNFEARVDENFASLLDDLSDYVNRLSALENENSGVPWETFENFLAYVNGFDVRLSKLEKGASIPVEVIILAIAIIIVVILGAKFGWFREMLFGQQGPPIKVPEGDQVVRIVNLLRSHGYKIEKAEGPPPESPAGSSDVSG